MCYSFFRANLTPTGKISRLLIRSCTSWGGDSVHEPVLNRTDYSDIVGLAFICFLTPALCVTSGSTRGGSDVELLRRRNPPEAQLRVTPPKTRKTTKRLLNSANYHLIKEGGAEEEILRTHHDRGAVRLRGPRLVSPPSSTNWDHLIQT